jgi:hypothetical protein
MMPPLPGLDGVLTKTSRNDGKTTSICHVDVGPVITSRWLHMLYDHAGYEYDDIALLNAEKYP